MIRSIADCGFEHSSQVQHECVPQAILSMYVLCQAKSGMSKTSVFVLETLQQLDVDEGLSRVLVLCHTRELAFQIIEEYERFCKYMPSMKVSNVLESVSMRADIQQIRDEMIDCIGITKEKCFADETSRWRTKMAATIFNCQWTGQGSHKDPLICSWAPDWGRGPDPDPIIIFSNYNFL